MHSPCTCALASNPCSNAGCNKASRFVYLPQGSGYEGQSGVAGGAYINQQDQGSNAALAAGAGAAGTAAYGNRGDITRDGQTAHLHQVSILSSSIISSHVCPVCSSAGRMPEQSCDLCCVLRMRRFLPGTSCACSERFPKIATLIRLSDRGRRA